MRLAFILNPAAGNGRAGRQRGPLEEALRRAGLAADLVLTTAPGHAERLAREAAVTADVVVAVGGDGTIQEVARGLVGTGAAMGVLPLGTGNDFAHALGMPDDLDAALAALLAAPAVPVDLGRVRWRERTPDGAEARHEALFANCLGVGFDALAAQEAARFKLLRGKSGYVAGVLRALFAWHQPTVEVEVVLADGEATVAGSTRGSTRGSMPPAPDVWTRFYTGRLFLMEVGNGFSVGGGFWLTPDAVVDDGALDVCLIERVPTRRVLRLLPSTFTGGHVGEPEVRLGRVRRVVLRSEADLPVHADGEALSRSAREVEAEVVAGALRLRAPAIRRPTSSPALAAPAGSPFGPGRS